VIVKISQVSRCSCNYRVGRRHQLLDWIALGLRVTRQSQQTLNHTGFGSLKTTSTLSARRRERLSCIRSEGLVGETLADWCYSVRPGQKSSTSLSTPHHLLQVEGIQWILRQREGGTEKESSFYRKGKVGFVCCESCALTLRLICFCFFNLD